MKNFGTVIDNFDAVTKQYVDDKASAKRIRGIKVDNATLADTANKVQNAFTYKVHNKAEGTVLPITYDGNRAASLDFSANDFTYDYNSFNNITVKLVGKGYATTSQVNAKYTKPESGIPKSDLATSVQTSLDKADSALQSAPVTSVNGKTGAVQLGASDVGALPTSTKYVVSVNGESGEVKNIAKTNSANTFTGDQIVTGNGSVSGNFTVGGNLTINGTTTTVDSTTLQVKDKLIEVAHGNTTSLTTPAGLVAPKYDGTSSGALVFDSTGTAYVGDVTLDSAGNIDVANSELQPLATRTGLVGGNLVQYDSSALTLKDSGKKIGDLALKTDLSGKANLSGGNTFSGNQVITGYLDIRGTAAEKHLKTHGIGGSDGNGNSSDLYLQYSSDYKTYFGKTGQSSLNADGSISINGKTAATTDQIPAAANNGKLTIQKNGTDVQTFTANQSSSVTANITVPTKASDVNALSLDGGTINKSKTIKMDASANSDGANLKWGTVNSKNPYIGYASDQVDGTFVVGSLLGTNYASGLAIDGGSGNLLWKGTKVATTSDIPTNYVTTDTTQTISGAKTFTSDVVVNKATPKFNMKLSGLTNGTTPSANQFGEVCFLDKNGVYEGGIRFDSPTNGENRTKLSTNSFGTTHSNYVGLFAKKNASSATATDIWRFIPNQDAVIDLGQSDLRWRNVRAVTTYSNVYGSDLCSTNSLRLKDPNITRGTNQAASGGKQNYYRAININDKNNYKGVAVEWGYLCEKNSNGNTTKHVSELNLLVYPPNTTDNANFVKVALGKRSDGTTYFTYAGDQVITTKNFSLSGTTLTITL